VLGIGINNADYQVQPTVDNKQMLCPHYRTWKGMLERCYCTKYLQKFPTYKGCSVCVAWLTFSNFKSWMESQDWEGKELDKDILIRGNKQYSPETCIFISQEINKLVNKQLNTSGKYLLGVSWNKSSKKFIAQCSVNGKVQFLGKFISEFEASKVYLAFKRKRIIMIANQQENIKLKNALLHIANTEY